MTAPSSLRALYGSPSLRLNVLIGACVLSLGTLDLHLWHWPCFSSLLSSFLSNSLAIWSLDIWLPPMCQPCASAGVTGEWGVSAFMELTVHWGTLMKKCDRWHGRETQVHVLSNGWVMRLLRLKEMGYLIQALTDADDRVGTNGIIQEQKIGLLPPPPSWGCPEPTVRRNLFWFFLIQLHIVQTRPSP